MIDFASLPKVVAIVGSRYWTEDRWIKKAVYTLKPETVVVSGGAMGVDSFVQEAVYNRIVRKHDLSFKAFPVADWEWEKLGKRAGFARNRSMLTWVKYYGGHCIIFTFKEAIAAKKGGSYDDVKVCEELSIPYTLITI